MDELAVARAELARLEDTERNLVKQLSDVRVAAAAERKRINELIQERPPIIQRLPIELLSSILHLALRGPNPSRKKILACVSRHWRDLILEQPSFWSTIEVGSGQNLRRMREQLEKSREAPLDVTIRDDDSYDIIHEGLDLLIPFASRWRALTWNEMTTPTRQFIMDHIDGIKFPSLKCVKLKSSYSPPSFLSPTNIPVLEHLEVRNEYGSPALHPLLGCNSLLSDHIPVLTLVTLSLSGYVLLSGVELPNSVHFPVLETLKVNIRNTGHLLKVIITPKLRSFEYTLHSDDPLPTDFSDLEGKFGSVKQVSFAIQFESLDRSDALALCRVFPNVCHAELRSDSPLSVFFGPCEGVDALQPPAGYWKDLDSLTFPEIDPDMWLEPPIRKTNAFVQWLVARQDQRPLRVCIKGFCAPDEDIGSFCMLYDILQEHCAVELKDIRLWPESELSKSVDSGLQLHVPMFTSGLADDIGAVVGGIGKSGQASYQ
ncbi:hypothetical protein BKA82DRAFT_29365 [Pisolithus tinctorius]|nr:hypothetical protein BKA82DRAFT_29365 [Pisolithus tinctorius]